MRTAAGPRPSRRFGARQRGAVAVLVGVMLVVLMLVLGLAVDLGHLYIAKAELQNAADACALSGARELNDLGTGALDRATAAAITAGNRNSVDLQAVDLRASGQGIQPADVTFAESLAGPYSRTITIKTGYIRCAARQSNPQSVALWFMGVVGLSEWKLSAQATARTLGGQGSCATPLAMCATAVNLTKEDLGFTRGQWYSGRLAAGTASQGNYEWVRFSGSGASSLADVIAGPGMCSIGPAKVDVEPGVSAGVAQAWNTRFGLYAGTYRDVDLYPPDRTGYAYTPNRTTSKGVLVPGSWPAPAPQNAYDDYVKRKNVTHDPYNPSALLEDNGNPAILPGNPAPLASSVHAEKGQDRRMVFVPIIGCSDWAPSKKNMNVVDWACAFMIAPINDPNADVQLEYRGLLSKGACATFGVPGHVGPPVPALVE